jgi:hypothetical protein
MYVLYNTHKLKEGYQNDSIIRKCANYSMQIKREV